MLNQVSSGGFKMVATTNSFLAVGWSLFCSLMVFLRFRMLLVMVLKVPPFRRSFIPATSRNLMGILYLA